jgi:hypothetical protein
MSLRCATEVVPMVETMDDPKPISRPEETNPVTIGLDYGSVNVKAVVTRPTAPDAKPLHVFEKPAQGIPLLAGASLLSDIRRDLGDTPVAVGITGVAAPKTNEVVTTSAAVGLTHPQVRTIFDLGGQFSNRITVHPHGRVSGAIGIGCMVGIAASTTIGAIRNDHDDIPIISLAYGGKEGPAQQIQLETFIHQVRQRYARRVNRPVPNRQCSTARS